MQYLPALGVVKCQAGDRTATVCIAVFKHLATSLQIPQFNHLHTELF